MDDVGGTGTLWRKIRDVGKQDSIRTLRADPMGRVWADASAVQLDSWTVSE